MRKRTGKWFMLRVTDRDRDRETLYLEKVLKKVDTYACFEAPHPSAEKNSGNDNYHYHSIHQRQKTTLKDRIVALGWLGNQNHAFTHLYEDTDAHWDRSLCYISKGACRGEYPVIVRNDFGFTEQKIWEMHYRWWDEWSVVQNEHPAQQEKKTKFQEMYEHVGASAFKEGPLAIAKRIIIFYNDRDLNEPNNFQLRCYLTSMIRKHVMTHADPITKEQYLTQRAKEILGREDTGFYYAGIGDDGKSLRKAERIREALDQLPKKSKFTDHDVENYFLNE